MSSVKGCVFLQFTNDTWPVLASNVLCVYWVHSMECKWTEAESVAFLRSTECQQLSS